MNTTTRRRFIEILPLAGVGLLAACSDKAAPPSQTAAPPPVADPVPTAATTVAPASSPTTEAAVTAALPMVDEKEAVAVSLGYVSDASRADTAKFKTYTAGSACGNCSLYGGKPGDPSGPCPLFNGHQVSVKGWCSAYAKKAG